MQVTKKVNDGISVVANGETLMETFTQLAALEEVFGDSKCGKCGSTDIYYAIRKSKDEEGEEFTYPELRCKAQGCWAKLTFGQGKGGVLYPKRFETGKKGKYIKGEDGKYIPFGNNGWVKYNKESGKEE